MTIDTERLKTDAAYWLESDPSDGEATHFEPAYADHECAWVRVDRKGLRHYFYDGSWVCADKTNDDIGPVDSMIPRPTKPAEPDWVDELPPVGCECEGDADTRPGGYEKCLVVYHDECAGTLEHNSLCLFQARPGGKFTEPEWCSDFRPIRTPEQRQREELIGMLTEGNNMYRDDAEEYADAIIAAGYRKQERD